MKTKIIFKIKNITGKEFEMLNDALEKSEGIILSSEVTILIKNKEGYWEKIK